MRIMKVWPEYLESVEYIRLLPVYSMYIWAPHFTKRVYLLQRLPSCMWLHTQNIDWSDVIFLQKHFNDHDEAGSLEVSHLCWQTIQFANWFSFDSPTECTRMSAYRWGIYNLVIFNLTTYSIPAPRSKG